MKRAPFFLLITMLTLLVTSCNNVQKEEVKNDKKETKVIPASSTDEEIILTEKTAAEILVGGSWNNPASAQSEDIIFAADENMFWRNGNDEGQGKWEVKGTDVLHFYNEDYKIESLTELELIVSKKGERTTYERNLSETSDCNPRFEIEGINDTKGYYTNGNESWTIHFLENNFIAFYTKDGKQGNAMTILKTEKRSNCEYSIIMEGIQGELVPTWTLKYNEEKKIYDLYTYEYDAEADSWSDKIYIGSSDND
jgi:hypothetical protein